MSPARGKLIWEELNLVVPNVLYLPQASKNLWSSFTAKEIAGIADRCTEGYMFDTVRNIRYPTTTRFGKGWITDKSYQFFDPIREDLITEEILDLHDSNMAKLRAIPDLANMIIHARLMHRDIEGINIPKCSVCAIAKMTHSKSIQCPDVYEKIEKVGDCILIDGAGPRSITKHHKKRYIYIAMDAHSKIGEVLAVRRKEHAPVDVLKKFII